MCAHLLQLSFVLRKLATEGLQQTGEMLCSNVTDSQQLQSAAFAADPEMVLESGSLAGSFIALQNMVDLLVWLPFKGENFRQTIRRFSVSTAENFETQVPVPPSLSLSRLHR